MGTEIEDDGPKLAVGRRLTWFVLMAKGDSCDYFALCLGHRVIVRMLPLLPTIRWHFSGPVSLGDQ